MNGVTTSESANLPVDFYGLTEKMRRCVEIFVETGGQNWTRAAVAAGYSLNGAGVAGNRVAHHPVALAYLRYLIETRIRSASAGALATLQELCASGPSDVRLRAANSILDRAAHMAVRHSEHTITVRDERTDAETVKLLHEQAKKLGLAPDTIRQLLGPAADGIIDAEFTEAGDTEADDGEVW